MLDVEEDADVVVVMMVDVEEVDVMAGVEEGDVMVGVEEVLLMVEGAWVVIVSFLFVNLLERRYLVHGYGAMGSNRKQPQWQWNSSIAHVYSQCKDNEYDTGNACVGWKISSVYS